ncbi:hypothetical protein PMNALOAF_0729 [Methylobacterium adhaesivum]|jgi:hypothetical protein|uniref:Uncharacterized protein n=1 Tax=Methylobacterium adhaesivum TaxID=333297 RepID=A0ABT8BM06_9HYPH|nr:hypothetical protein [Methylobacterium adhaesivum]MDN3592858.1 hypothetical protein [Methylobacterium adhaesivum]GJD29496.1 hypothetical protein PMNALOAF_0729 [Methylobacterium adhaesivum]
MRIVPLTLMWFATLAVPAWPEDFTGAYAGVNAGYASSTADRVRMPDLLAPDAAGLVEMPPSARQASEVLRTRNLRDRSGAVSR